MVTGEFPPTLKDFFLLIILVSYMSMLRLTANMLNIWSLGWFTLSWSELVTLVCSPYLCT